MALTVALARFATIATFGLACHAFSAQAGTFVPNEALVSAAPDLVDLEYSKERAQYARVDYDGRLWVGDIDRSTGDFVQPDGKQILVDADATSLSDLAWVFNGPEWISTPDGDQVLYTRIVHGERHKAANARIGLAKPGPDGRWMAELLPPDVARYDPIGSDESTGGEPALLYLDQHKNKLWRNLSSPTEEIVPGTTTNGANTIRFVRGARAIVYRLKADGVWQAFRYDLDTKVLEQLTFDDGAKGVVWMWRAPEFSGDFVLLAQVGRRQIRVYRHLPTGPHGELQWTVIYKVECPAGSQLQSLEPFTYNGRSFMFMQLVVEPNSFPSEIWFSNIDASKPIWRRISDNKELSIRRDPEYFITSHGPIIYYNRYKSDVPKDEGSLGVYRADPGIDKD